MESHRLRAEMNEQEWENATEASRFCWPARASLCQPLSEQLRYPSGLPLSVLDSGSTEGPFKIRPLLPLAELQIKAHSEGDSSAHGPPLGNG